MSALEELVLRSSELARKDEWGREALAVNGRLTELAPHAAVAWARYARCLRRARRSEEARAAYAQVLELKPGGLHETVARRELLELAEEIRAGAEESFGEARRRAEELVALGAPERALPWLERAVELAGSPAEQIGTLVSWAGVLRGLRRRDEALERVREALALDRSREGNRDSYVALVAVLTDLGRLDEAVAEAERLVRIHPGDMAVHNAAERARAERFRRG